MRKMFILFLLLAGGTPSFGQDTSGSSATLSLEDCIHLALKNRVELRIASKDIENSKEQIKEAKSYYLPRLNLNAGYTHFNEPIEIDTNLDISAVASKYNSAVAFLTGQFGFPLQPIPNALHEEFKIGKTNWTALSVNLTQPVYTFGRIEEAVKQAKTGRSIAENQKDRKRMEIITEVKKAYYQYLFLREVGKVLSDADATAGIVTRMVKIAYETSSPDKDEKGTTRVDYLQARNFHSEIKAKLVETNSALDSAEVALKYALGVNIDSGLSLKEASLDSLPTTFLDSRGIETALEKNADLKTVKLGVQLYDSKRRAAKNEYFPKIGIQGQYIGPEDRFGIKNSWFIGIGLEMTLFDGFLTKAKVAQSRIQFEKVKDQQVTLEQAISAQTSGLQKALARLEEKIKILKPTLEEARERVDLASDGFSAGLIEYEKVLYAQKTELEMKAAYLQTLFLYHTMKSDLEFLSGSVNP